MFLVIYCLFVVKVRVPTLRYP